MFVIVQYSGCGRIGVETDFEHDVIVVGRERWDGLGFGGGTSLRECYIEDTSE